MGNGFKHHLHQRSTTTTTATNTNIHGIFLPMLCSRPSIKNAHVISKWSDNQDPSSPKVSCIGQVKNNLRNNNKVTGFPTFRPPPYKLTAATATTNVKYHKLKRLFSGKNLTTTTGTATRRTKSSNSVENDSFAPVVVDIALLDPPLPVVKRAVEDQVNSNNNNNLWKRRSGRADLKISQLNQIHIPNKSHINNYY